MFVLIEKSCCKSWSRLKLSAIAINKFLFTLVLFDKTIYLCPGFTPIKPNFTLFEKKINFFNTV